MPPAAMADDAVDKDKGAGRRPSGTAAMKTEPGDRSDKVNESDDEDAIYDPYTIIYKTRYNGRWHSTTFVCYGLAEAHVQLARATTNVAKRDPLPEEVEITMRTTYIKKIKGTASRGAEEVITLGELPWERSPKKLKPTPKWASRGTSATRTDPRQGAGVTERDTQVRREGRGREEEKHARRDEGGKEHQRKPTQEKVDRGAKDHKTADRQGKRTPAKETATPTTTVQKATGAGRGTGKDSRTASGAGKTAGAAAVERVKKLAEERRKEAQKVQAQKEAKAAKEKEEAKIILQKAKEAAARKVEREQAEKATADRRRSPSKEGREISSSTSQEDVESEASNITQERKSDPDWGSDAGASETEEDRDDDATEIRKWRDRGETADKGRRATRTPTRSRSRSALRRKHIPVPTHKKKWDLRPRRREERGHGDPSPPHKGRHQWEDRAKRGWSGGDIRWSKWKR